MRLSCGFIAFLLALLFSSSSFADPRGPVVARLRVKGEKQRAEVTVEGSFAVPVYSINSLNEGKQVVLELEGDSRSDSPSADLYESAGRDLI